VKKQIAIILVVLMAPLGFAEAQQPDRVIVSVAEAPIFLRPDNTMAPLRMAMYGSSLVALKAQTGWYQVEFLDPQFGQRVGFIELRYVHAGVTRALDLSIPTNTHSPDVNALQLIPSRSIARMPVIRSAQSRNHTFQKARLSLQVEEKTEAVDVIVMYDDAALVIRDKKTNRALKTLPYAEITGGEYSYAKSPRWKTAIFVSPLFLFTSGKKHWFLTQGKDDHALLHLDKENYRLMLAAFETKTGLKVETVSDSK
jgi:hypothetical protein